MQTQLPFVVSLPIGHAVPSSASTPGAVSQYMVDAYPWQAVLCLSMPYLVGIR